MSREVDPRETSRASAFENWTDSPMPMVTLFKTLNVTRAVLISRRTGVKFNAILNWCIGKAASQVPEFYLLPVGGKLVEYDRLAINVVASNSEGGINTCDILFNENFSLFYDDYLKRTRRTFVECDNLDVEDAMVIGTSSLKDCEIDGAVNIYSGVFNNPFLIWGKYRKKFFKWMLPISFQFHHVQMDGHEAATFLNLLQKSIETFRV